MGSLHLGCALVGIVIFLSFVNASQEKEEKPTLYMYEYAFYPQKVMLALHEKGVKFIQRSVNLIKGENYQEPFLEINPTGEVPVLVETNRDIIPDSAGIIDHLEEKYPAAFFPELRSLIPRDEDERQMMNEFQKDLDAIDGDKLLYGTLYFPWIPQNPKFPYISFMRSFLKDYLEGRSNQLTKIAKRYPKFAGPLLDKAVRSEEGVTAAKNIVNLSDLLDKVDDILEDTNIRLSSLPADWWLINKDFTLADVSLTNLLERLHVIGFSHRFWGDGKNPKVEEYYKRVQQRPSYKATYPGLITHIKTVWQALLQKVKDLILSDKSNN